MIFSVTEHDLKIAKRDVVVDVSYGGVTEHLKSLEFSLNDIIDSLGDSEALPEKIENGLQQIIWFITSVEGEIKTYKHASSFDSSLCKRLGYADGLYFENCLKNDLFALLSTTKSFNVEKWGACCDGIIYTLLQLTRVLFVD